MPDLSTATKYIDVYVKLPTGKTLSFLLSPGDKVQCVYNRTAKETGVPEERVKIKYTGKVLQKSDTVGYLGICKETILKAEIIHVKKLRIFVKLPCGKNLEVHVQNVSPLYFIKNQIEAEEGVAPSLQILKYGNHTLSKENETVMDAGVVDGATIELMKRSKPESPKLTEKGAAQAKDDQNTMKESDKEAILNSFNCQGKRVEIVFSFDTTGSMYSCLEQVRIRLRETVCRLLHEIPGIRIAVIAHGDYCDYNNYVMRSVDLTSDVDSLTDFVNNVPSTGGGDCPECYEWVLHQTQQLDWSEDSAKALVMIGDSPPHEVSYTDQQINWHDELDVLTGMSIKVYGVRAQDQTSSVPFYQELAERSGGAYITFNHFSIISDMFLAVCYKEASDEQFEAFCEEIQQKQEDGNADESQNVEAAAEIKQVLNQIQQQGQHSPPQQQRYVATAWWDPNLDYGSPSFHYNSALDSWQSAPSSITAAPSLAERRLASTMTHSSRKNSAKPTAMKTSKKRACVIM